MRRMTLKNQVQTNPEKLSARELAVLSALVTESMFRQNGSMLPPGFLDDAFSDDVKSNYKSIIDGLVAKGLIFRKRVENKEGIVDADDVVRKVIEVYQLRPEAINTVFAYNNCGGPTIINFLSVSMEAFYNATKVDSSEVSQEIDPKNLPN